MALFITKNVCLKYMITLHTYVLSKNNIWYAYTKYRQYVNTYLQFNFNHKYLYLLQGVNEPHLFEIVKQISFDHLAVN